MAANLFSTKFTCETLVSSTMAIMEWKQQMVCAYFSYAINDYGQWSPFTSGHADTCSAMATIVSALERNWGDINPSPPVPTTIAMK